MVLGQLENMKIVGFRSQFSFVYGDNSDCYFLKCLRGIGINPNSKLEGMRKNNLICTHLLGPILPLNPLFCENLLQLCGCDAKAAYRETAMDAYNQRLAEFSDPNVKFESTH
jgi:CobQ-like glutamine amidotransferase family enzyme